MHRGLLIPIVATTALTGGCGGGHRSEGPERIAKVVVSVPTKGAGSPLARDMIEAARMEVARRSGRAGAAKVVLSVESESGDGSGRAEPERIARQAAAAVADRDTVGWLGGFDSNTTAVALPLLNSGGVSAVSALAAATPLTGRDPDFPGAPAKYFPRADIYGRNFARLTADDRRIATTALAVAHRGGSRSIFAIDAGDTDGVAFSSAIESGARASRIRFAGRESVAPGQVDWDAVVAEATAARADALAWGSVAGSGEQGLWEAIGRTGARLKLLVGPAVPHDVLAELPAIPAGASSFTGFAPAGRSGGPGPGFVTRFRKRTGRDPLPGAANAETAMALLMDAIASGSRTAGPSQNGDDLRAATSRALHRIRRLRSPWGPVTIDRAGTPVSGPVAWWSISPGSIRFAGSRP